MTKQLTPQMMKTTDTFGPHVITDNAQETGDAGDGGGRAGNMAGRATIDWKNPESMRELTRVMLRHDFGIEWDVPLDRLCPPVANRLNYICWLSDLMKLSDTAVGGDGTFGHAKREQESSDARAKEEAERNLLLFGIGDGGGDRGSSGGVPGGSEAMAVCEEDTGEALVKDISGAVAGEAVRVCVGVGP